MVQQVRCPASPCALALIHLDAVMKLYRCVVGIKMKAEFEDGCGPTHDY